MSYLLAVGDNMVEICMSHLKFLARIAYGYYQPRLQYGRVTLSVQLRVCFTALWNFGSRSQELRLDQGFAPSEPNSWEKQKKEHKRP